MRNTATFLLIGSIMGAAATMRAEEKESAAGKGLFRRVKEDPKALVVGKWVSDDKERNPLEFRKDGTARIGFIKEKGKWLMATGKYTVSDKGRVECKVKYQQIMLTGYWTLKNGVLVGPRGPKPMVTWVKVKKGKHKK